MYSWYASIINTNMRAASKGPEAFFSGADSPFLQLVNSYFVEKIKDKN